MLIAGKMQLSGKGIRWFKCLWHAAAEPCGMQPSCSQLAASRRGCTSLPSPAPALLQSGHVLQVRAAQDQAAAAQSEAQEACAKLAASVAEQQRAARLDAELKEMRAAHEQALQVQKVLADNSWHCHSCPQAHELAACESSIMLQ